MLNTIKEIRLESGMCDATIKGRMKVLGIKGPLLSNEDKERVINYKKAKSGGHWGGKYYGC